MNNAKCLTIMVGAYLFLATAFFSTSVPAQDLSGVRQDSKLHVAWSFGLGYTTVAVIPNTNDQYYDGIGGVGLGIGIDAELTLSKPFALTARIEGFNSYSLSNENGGTDGVDGLAFMVSAGVILGKRRQPHQVYISATLGAGIATFRGPGLDNLDREDCTQCSGGGSAGLSGRLAIGYTKSSSTRVELAFMRVGGDGNDKNYPNGEDAYLQTVMIQIIKNH